jgi:hypothetical protein
MADAAERVSALSDQLRYIQDQQTAIVNGARALLDQSLQVGGPTAHDCR